MSAPLMASPQQSMTQSLPTRRYRRTKIVATLGPASSSPEMIDALVGAGVDTFRLNFSHGRMEDHYQRAHMAREAASRHGVEVALLGDLQGPKIRIAGFRDGTVELVAGEPFTLDCSLGRDDGDVRTVGVDFPPLPDSVAPGDTLLLDDGRLRLTVTEVDGQRVHCRVLLGGRLSSRKGLNRLGGGLSAPALTAKDHEDIGHARALGLDYVAVSFPARAADVDEARSSLERHGSQARVVAKIERAEAVADDQVLEDIIAAADAIMVARGDLGVEIGDAELIGIQKKLISQARRMNRAVITATQMMESMISSPIPTRAEVFDVANAVLDGTDAVMLSAETATGQYPVETVRAVAETCLGAERQPSTQRSSHRIDRRFGRVDEAIAMSSVYAANHLDNVGGIICLTESGSTPLWMSRLRSGLPIYALSRDVTTLRRVRLFRGVMPVYFDAHSDEPEGAANEAVAVLQRRGLARPGERFILTHGERVGVGSGTNTMTIVTV
jgi:pyruvate kinase